MKISDRNTGLHYLRDNDPMIFGAIPGDQGIQEAGGFLRHVFREKRTQFRKKIQYMSLPFFNAYLKSRPKLREIFVKEPIEQSGTLITPCDKGGVRTTFYDLFAKVDPFGIWGVSCTVAIFFVGKGCPMLVSLIYKNYDGERAFISDEINKSDLVPDQIISDLLMMVLFMKFCDLETKIILPGKKGFLVQQKYVNDTGQPVEILDSTWFTTIVRSEGFMVGAATGGFFRLQPCGPGLTQKKLIWIEPFQKLGYTRKAKMLRDSGDEQVPH